MIFRRNKVLRRHRARGILVTTPESAVIEKNLFSTAGTAILIEGDTDYWFESGAIRDLVRGVQNLRKESGFEVSDRIALRWEGEEIFSQVFASHGQTIARETLSNSITSATLDCEVYEVADLPLKIEVTRVI